MSLTLDMLHAAAKAPKLLGAETGRVEQFLASQLCGDGGFCGRGDGSDLYFTVFGVNCLLALGRRPPAETTAFLRSFGRGDGLDFVHLACLARCWASVGQSPPDDVRDSILNRIKQFRSSDGGFSQSPASETGTAYGCFLAVGVYQDLGAHLPDPPAVAACLNSLRTDDGGYSNFPGAAVGITPAAAAAITALRQLGREVDHSAADWLLTQCRGSEGFLAVPAAPVGDLLSTATALHALATIGRDLTPIRQQCVKFVRSLWNPRGAFRANSADGHLDCEYTFYGLLALGHLSE